MRRSLRLTRPQVSTVDLCVCSSNEVTKHLRFCKRSRHALDPSVMPARPDLSYLNTYRRARHLQPQRAGRVRGRKTAGCHQPRRRGQSRRRRRRPRCGGGGGGGIARCIREFLFVGFSLFLLRFCGEGRASPRPAGGSERSGGGCRVPPLDVLLCGASGPAAPHDAATALPGDRGRR